MFTVQSALCLIKVAGIFTGYYTGIYRTEAAILLYECEHHVTELSALSILKYSRPVEDRLGPIINMSNQFDVLTNAKGSKIISETYQ